MKRAIPIFLFWIAAAVLVAIFHLQLDANAPVSAAIAGAASIVAVSFAYTRLCARDCGISHALGVGSVWLALAIAGELAISGRVGHGWFSLIGSPDRPLLRNLFLFVWIFAPALFAHHEVPH